ncbi:MAG: hypothetical protein A2Z25_24690 [Planctomycetes bacterium RBG_16_55_9]|nr:MAG: hypothetical protein A2Z25_24690 [Planctomycetes bacterium RBG_16_55_9]
MRLDSVELVMKQLGIKRLSQNHSGHCEERSDEAISISEVEDCFAALAMTTQNAGFEMVSNESKYTEDSRFVQDFGMN